MVLLVDSDIQTRDVLDWKGLHLFHFESSSCSEKVRIFLALKGLDWESHHIDLDTDQNYTEWYLGINPRGLVPALVHDGRVHIESNDIISYLEETFPEPVLIPAGKQDEIKRLLRQEDDLHLDLRTLTFGLLLAAQGPPKSEASLRNYERGGAGTVAGVKDPRKQVELDFWRDAAKHGITEKQIVASAQKFHAALTGLETALQTQACLLGELPSVVDIAWYIYTNRLIVTGYPVQELHPKLAAWFAELDGRAEWSSSLPEYDHVPEKSTADYTKLEERKRIFRKISGL